MRIKCQHYYERTSPVSHTRWISQIASTPPATLFSGGKISADSLSASKTVRDASTTSSGNFWVFLNIQCLAGERDGATVVGSEQWGVAVSVSWVP